MCFLKSLFRWGWTGSKTLLLVLFFACGCSHTRQINWSDVPRERAWSALLLSDTVDELQEIIDSGLPIHDLLRQINWPEVTRVKVLCAFFVNDDAEGLQKAIDSGLPIHNLYGIYGNNATGIGVAKPRGERWEFAREAAPLLMDAIHSSATNCAMCLLRNGVNPSVCSSDDRTVLQDCVLLRGEALERFLRLFLTEYHMTNEIDKQSVWGETPLHGAIMVGNLDMVRLLVENGADYKAKKYRLGRYIPDKRTFPIVFSAVCSESEEVFEYILGLTPPEDLWYSDNKSILSLMNLDVNMMQVRFSKLAPLVWADRESMMRHENIYVAKMKFNQCDCERIISFLNGFDFPSPYLETALEYARAHNFSRSAGLLEAKLAELRRMEDSAANHPKDAD